MLGERGPAARGDRAAAARDRGQPVLPGRGGARARRGGGRAQPGRRRAACPARSPPAACTASCGAASTRSPRRARPLLEAAAVIGRQHRSRRCSRRLEPEADLDAWIRHLRQRGGARRLHEGGFRFAHDKLREGLLADAVARGAPRPAPPRRRGHRGRVPATRPSTPRRSPTTGRVAGDDREGGALLGARRRAGAPEQRLPGGGDLLRARHRHRLRRRRGGRAAARAASVARALSRARARSSRSRREAVARGERSLPPRPLGGPPLGGVRPPVQPRRVVPARRARARLPGPADARRATPGSLAGLPVQMALRGLHVAVARRASSRPSDDARAVLLEATRIHTRVTEACFYTQESLPHALERPLHAQPGRARGPLGEPGLRLRADGGGRRRHPPPRHGRGLEPARARARRERGQALRRRLRPAAGELLPAVDGRVGGRRGRASRGEVDIARRVGDQRAPQRRHELPGALAPLPGPLRPASSALLAELDVWVRKHRRRRSASGRAASSRRRRCSASASRRAAVALCREVPAARRRRRRQPRGHPLLRRAGPRPRCAPATPRRAPRGRRPRARRDPGHPAGGLLDPRRHRRRRRGRAHAVGGVAARPPTSAPRPAAGLPARRRAYAAVFPIGAALRAPLARGSSSSSRATPPRRAARGSAASPSPSGWACPTSAAAPTWRSAGTCRRAIPQRRRLLAQAAATFAELGAEHDHGRAEAALG